MQPIKKEELQQSAHINYSDPLRQVKWPLPQATYPVEVRGGVSKTPYAQEKIN